MGQRAILRISASTGSLSSTAPVRLGPTSDPVQWDALVARSPHATPFHEFGLLSAMSDLFGWRFKPMLVEQNGTAIGVVPLIALRRVPMTPRIPFPYVGPLLPAELLDTTLASVRSWQRRSGQLVVRLALPPSVGRVDVTRAGVHVTARDTYELDLSHGSVEQYEAGLHADRRQALRRAARAGLRASPTVPGEVTALLPGLMTEAYSRHGGVPPYPAGVAAWIDARLQTDGVHAVTVRAGHEPIGLLIALRRGSTMFGWLGATKRSGPARDAGTVAYDALIRLALELGVEAFDFVGHVDDGVSRFKRSFGAAPTSYWDVTSKLLPFDVDRVADLRHLAKRPRH